ncbi:hypothetical protein KQI58_03090 [Enterococcus raffinosus]|uniref:hypothetical protein n=1 Tax=Enterococcus raffinosus TaxID=71452 RepID=UPI001C0FE557|nr:hypothetical protein [Enterococcus raffinosus]MBU5360065.1 hypothetical protein [Enterococcus raffinosus]
MADWHTQLDSTWEIKGTNFPMWLTDKRKNPRITYKRAEKNAVELLDLVEYEVNGKTKQIKGIDRLVGDQFVWRGIGIMRILSSRWQVVTIKGDVLVIRFEKSFITPAGVDILIRRGSRTPNLRERVLEHYESFGLTVAEIETLQWK